MPYHLSERVKHKMGGIAKQTKLITHFVKKLSVEAEGSESNGRMAASQIARKLQAINLIIFREI